MVDVIVAIPTFRRPNSLDRLLVAIGKLETEASVRVLVADNDAARREGIGVVERLTTAGYRWPIEAFAVEKRGIAEVRNALVARAAADGFDYLAMIDDDEWPEPAWLDAFLRVAMSTGADALHGAVVPEFETAPGQWASRCYGFSPLRGATGPVPMIHSTSNVLLRESAPGMIEPPLFDTAFALSGGEDEDFFRRLKMAGARFAWADEAVVHAEMPPSRANPRWAIQRAFSTGNSDMRVFLKHSNALREKAIESARIAGALIVSLPLALLVAPLAGWRMAFVCKFVRAAGKLAAVLGLRYNEYTAVHGN